MDEKAIVEKVRNQLSKIYKDAREYKDIFIKHFTPENMYKECQTRHEELLMELPDILEQAINLVIEHTIKTHDIRHELREKLKEPPFRYWVTTTLMNTLDAACED